MSCQNFPAAFPLLAQAYAILQQTGRLAGICMVGTVLGQFLCAMGQRAEGLKVLTRSRDGSLKLGQARMAKQTQALLDQLAQPSPPS